jgi:hypothetical protein
MTNTISELNKNILLLKQKIRANGNLSQIQSQFGIMFEQFQSAAALTDFQIVLIIDVIQTLLSKDLLLDHIVQLFKEDQCYFFRVFKSLNTTNRVKLINILQTNDRLDKVMANGAKNEENAESLTYLWLFIVKQSSELNVKQTNLNAFLTKS